MTKGDIPGSCKSLSSIWIGKESAYLAKVIGSGLTAIYSTDRSCVLPELDQILAVSPAEQTFSSLTPRVESNECVQSTSHEYASCQDATSESVAKALPVQPQGVGGHAKQSLVTNPA